MDLMYGCLDVVFFFLSKEIPSVKCLLCKRRRLRNNSRVNGSNEGARCYVHHGLMRMTTCRPYSRYVYKEIIERNLWGKFCAYTNQPNHTGIRHVSLAPAFASRWIKMVLLGGYGGGCVVCGLTYTLRHFAAAAVMQNARADRERASSVQNVYIYKTNGVRPDDVWHTRARNGCNVLVDGFALLEWLCVALQTQNDLSEKGVRTLLVQSQCKSNQHRRQSIPPTNTFTSFVLWMPRSDSRLLHSFFWPSDENDRLMGCGAAITALVVSVCFPSSPEDALFMGSAEGYLNWRLYRFADNCRLSGTTVLLDYT